MSVSEVPRRTSFNPYTLLFLFAGAVVVAYVALGASLLRQHLDQNSLSSEIESAEAVLAGADDVRQDVGDLPARLAEAQRELTAAEIAFPRELDSNNIIQTILALADENQVRVLSLDAPPPVGEPTEEVSVDTSLSFDLQVEGDFGHLVAFLEALEEGATSTTRIGTFALQEGDGQWVLDLELMAYARSPTAEAPSPEDESTTAEGTEASSDGEEAPSE